MTSYSTIGGCQPVSLILDRLSTNSLADSDLRRDDPPVDNQTDSPDFSTLGGRMAWLRDQSGLSQGEFADVAGVGADTMSKWVNNRFKRGPYRSNLRSIAALFRAPVGALVKFVEEGGEPPALQPVMPNHNSHHPPRFVNSEAGGRIPVGTLPVINRVPAGRGAMTNQDYAANFSHETVDAGPWSSPGSQAFFIHGDSMKGIFDDGDLVIGDPNVPVKSGCYAIVQFEASERNCVRRVFSVEGKTLLVSNNEAFPEEAVAPEDIRTMLRIVEHRRRVE